jgi:histidinol-phosphate aminotransferase
MTVPIRRAVRGLPRYQPGKPPTVAPGGRAFKLSSNENPFPPLPGVLEAVSSAAEQMNRYPDMGNTAITTALAARLGVPEAHLAFGTGSVAVLYHLLQAVCEPGDEVVLAWRSFEAYPIAIALTGARAVPVPLGPRAEHDLDAMLAAVTPATRAVLLCTPNNPTGPALRHAEVAAFLEAASPRVLVVVDEAYVEFVSRGDAVRALELLDRPNVAVLRTFSKAYGLAGFRVGYGVMADPELASAVRATALPFGVSIVAQAAVLASLQEERALLDRVATLMQARDAMADGLRALGHDVPDAQGNFVWLPAAELTQEYGDRFNAAGVAVRPYASGSPEHDGVRITVGEAEANAIVLSVAADLPRPAGVRVSG